MNMNKLIALLLFLTASLCIYAADVEFPLVQSMSYFPYSDHHTLDKGDFSLSLDMFYSNVYMYDVQRTTINDMETWSNIIGVRYGISNRVTVEFYSRTMVVYGGVMDKLIIDFHKLFRMTEGGRKDFPRNRVNFHYKDVFSYDKSRLVLAPLVLGAVGNLYRSGNFSIDGRAAIGIPIAPEPGFSSSKPFYTAGIIFSYQKKNGKLSVDFANHISIFKKPTWLAKEELRNYIILSDLRVSYKKVFGGLGYRSTPFKTGDLANNAYLIYIGFRFLKHFAFSLVEEFPPVDTTPDVSFNLKIRLFESGFDI
ncbi:MAG TPA: DUF3187 family protein [Candidatus Kapabacteria bacterium]|nr:DUF3187 family protein [Candidatus Kapabacteria bacterium]